MYLSVISISINNTSRNKMCNFNICVSSLLFCVSFLFIPSHLQSNSVNIMLTTYYIENNIPVGNENEP